MRTVAQMQSAEVPVKDYPKLQCPYVRVKTPDNRYLVTTEVNEGYEWVFGDGVRAVDKLDGTNVCVHVRGGEVVAVDNRDTRKDILRVKGNKWGAAALEGVAGAMSRKWIWENGDHYGELIGPIINGNHHGLDRHLFVPFDYLWEKCHWISWVTNKYPKTFDSISAWFCEDLISLFNARIKLPKVWAEGVVFYHPDGKRRAKLRRDMFDWYDGPKKHEPKPQPQEDLPTLVPVQSSNMAAVGYRDDELVIEFKNGRRYVYSGVPREVYEGLMYAESKGRFFNENVRKAYVGVESKELS